MLRPTAARLPDSFMFTTVHLSVRTVIRQAIQLKGEKKDQPLFHRMKESGKPNFLVIRRRDSPFAIRASQGTQSNYGNNNQPAISNCASACTAARTAAKNDSHRAACHR